MTANTTESPLLGNRYQLQKTIGSGGMAVVYQARDLMLDRFVAVKILREDYSNNQAFRDRFRQEARAAANLSHPNIVTVHDFGYDQKRLYIVMEYIPGMNLKAVIKNRGIASFDESLALLIQACSGIGYAHRAGLVHCDIKPHNMLVTPDGRLKVTDFGISRALSSINPDEKNDVIWGSPHYLSPEQAKGLAPSPASDVYSLGVIMYEILTGQLPFDSSDPEELIRMHRDVQPVAPRKINPEIPIELEQIMLKVLSKEPSARYRTTDQLGRILSSFYSAGSNSVDAAAKDQLQAGNSKQYQPETPAPKPVKVIEATPKPDHITSEKTSEFDWTTIGLGLLAVLLAGGLIPFWMYVWFSITSSRLMP